MIGDDSKIKIDASHNLFHEYEMAGAALTRMREIIQNDMILDKNEVKDWNKRFIQLIGDIKQLRKKTIEYIKKCDKEEL